MFNKLINLSLVLILGLMVAGISQYKGPAPVACPTAEELDAVEWKCKTDSECNAEYKALYSVEPWECGDQA